MLLAPAASPFSLLLPAGEPRHYEFKSESTIVILFTECHRRVSSILVWSRVQVSTGRPTVFTKIHCYIPQGLAEEAGRRFLPHSLLSCNMPWRPIGLWGVEAPTSCTQSAHRCWWGFQLERRQPFAPRKISDAHFVKGLIDPRAIPRLEGLSQWINPMTSSGIETANFPACSIVSTSLTNICYLQCCSFLCHLTTVSVPRIHSIEGTMNISGTWPRFTPSYPGLQV
jgi:hypothetical protein